MAGLSSPMRRILRSSNCHVRAAAPAGVLLRRSRAPCAALTLCVPAWDAARLGARCRAAGSYTPFARGIMKAVSQAGARPAPEPLPVGAGEIPLEPPPQRPPRNQREWIAVNALPKRIPPPSGPREPEEVSLDGFLLLDACHVDDPEDATQAVLEGSGIVRVIEDDLGFFSRLSHLDVGDNRLKLEQLAALPALQELHIDCNGITALALPAGAFPRLEVLNLGYNGLNADAVGALGALPALRELDLTCNQLRQLPPDWSAFVELRKLTLDRNLLADDDALVAIGTVPYLRGARARVRAHGHRAPRCPCVRHGLTAQFSPPRAVPRAARGAELSVQSNKLARIANAAVQNGGYAEVQAIDLACNSIEHEDELVAVLQMGQLTALSVWGNPFLRGGRGREVPQAFVDVLSDRGVELVLTEPEPPRTTRGFNPESVLSLDAVVKSHRAAEIAMRTGARAQPTQPAQRCARGGVGGAACARAGRRDAALTPERCPHPCRARSKENLHVAQVKARLLAEREAEGAGAEIGSGGFFLTQSGAVRAGGGEGSERRGSGGASRAGTADGADSSALGAPSQSALNLRELQDTLLLSDEAEALIDSGIDVRTAINALKYALQHPLVEHDYDGPTHHMQTTAAYEAGRRRKYVRPADARDVGRANGGGVRGGASAARDGAAADGAGALDGTRHAALERSVDIVPAKLDALKRSLKVAEMAASAKTPAMTQEGMASLQSMLSALHQHEGH